MRASNHRGGDRKGFRWLSFPGLLILLVACSIISDDDDEPLPVERFRVNAETLNVRAAPSIKADVIARADRGTVVVPIDAAGEWYSVEMSDGSKGWIHSQYLLPVER